jgi:DNA-3-methyladenine glycosylase II
VAAATEELAGRDPVLARLVAVVGPCELDARRDLSHFGSLCRSITFQQLAGRAAATIFGRFVKVATGGGEAVDLTPEGVLACSVEELRAAGLSAAKTRSIRALAERTASGELPLHDVEGIGDEELIERLSAVPGIGRWTAEMFLIFQLGRLDVWPVGDLGVRKGYATAWGLPAMPTPKELLAYGETFRPYRSVAAWYCWRAVDTVLPDSSASTPPSAEPAAQPPAAKPAARKPAASGKAAAKKSPAKRS